MIVIGILFGIGVVTGAVGEKVVGQEYGADYQFTTTDIGGYGGACVKNYATCEEGYVNINYMLDNSKIGYVEDWGLNAKSLSLILAGITDSLNLCIAEKETGNIFPFLTMPEQLNGPAIRITAEKEMGAFNPSNTGTNVHVVPRICVNGTEPMESSFGLMFTTYGCCPSGYTYMNEFGNGAAPDLVQQWAGCCPILNNGQTAVDFDYVDGQYVYINGENDTGQLACKYNTNANAKGYVWLARPNNQDIITKHTSGAYVYGKSISPTYSNSGYHEPISELSNQKAGADYVCDPSEAGIKEYDCALVDGVSVVPANQLNTNSNLTCNSCFVTGAPIGILRSGELALCNKEGGVDKTPLINNSVNDTLAYLRTDAENKDLLKACRERGGIYIFVGCVDPTPLGFITGLIRITLGVVGGVALLQLIWVGILLQSGQEKQIAAARKNLFATLTGVAVLVFSILILRILGVNVLDILPAGSV